MKLSIIVCVYNTDIIYLEKCLKSLTQNTISALEYEICMVDDGSNIDYSDILNKYNVKYCKTENKGIFEARLLGISMASGDYIAFCDSDDTVSINFYAPMLDKANSYDADIVFNDWAFHTDSVRYICTHDKTVSTDFVYKGSAVLDAFLEVRGRQHSYFVLWNKIYKKSTLLAVKKECLKYIADGERYNYSEDALINFFAFSLAQTVTNVHTGYYFYRIHTGQSVNVISYERLLSHIKFMAKTLDTMRQNVNQALHPTALEDINEWAALMSRTHYTYAKNLGYTDLYPVIKASYKVDTLRVTSFGDGAAYSGAKVLADNFEEIDSELFAIASLNTSCTVDTVTLNAYSRGVLEFAVSQGKNIVFANGEGIKLSKPRISLVKRLIHSDFLYKIGTVLFPKGSKIRAALKKIV